MFKKIDSSDASSIGDDSMEAILKMLQMATSKDSQVAKLSTSTLHEDAMELLSTLVELLGERFSKYTQAFLPFLHQGLNYGSTDPSVCLASVVAIGDLAKALGKGFIEHSDSIMKALLQNMADDKVHRQIKPQILCVVGNIASAIGHHFTNYFAAVITVVNETVCKTECPALKQMRYIREKQIKIPPGVKIGPSEPEDEDAIEYRNELRVGCLKAYIGVIEGFKNTAGDASMDSHSSVVSVDLQLVIPHLTKICKLLTTTGEDKKRSAESISNAAKLIGILCVNYGTNVFRMLYVDEVLAILASGKRSRNYKIREISSSSFHQLKAITQSETSKNFNTKINNNQAVTTNVSSINME